MRTLLPRQNRIPAVEAATHRSAPILGSPRAEESRASDALRPDSPAPLGPNHDFSRLPILDGSQALVRAKLNVGPPGDAYEQEAERVAAAITFPTRCVQNVAPPRVQRLSWRPDAAAGAAPASVGRALAGQAQPLGPAILHEMGQHFGRDFSRVRVHTGSRAERSARDVGASAYTVGHDIVFGAGRFAPGTQEGRRLLAHELTHVVQQTGEGDAGREVRGPSPPVPLVQRQPAPSDEIEMPADYAFAADPRKRTYRRYARQLGQQDAARLRQRGGLSGEDREEFNAKLAFFEGEATEIYGAEVRPALLEVTRDPDAAAMEAAALKVSERMTFFNNVRSHPGYIDNRIKEVNYYAAEQAIIQYYDGPSLTLGLIPRWMTPPVVAVDYHTPPEQIRPFPDAKQGFSFIPESDLRNVPRGMPYEEMLRRYGRTVDFVADGTSGRIIPSKVNMLTAPTLCRVLLDSERRYVEQTEWVANWGTQVGRRLIPALNLCIMRRPPLPPDVQGKRDFSDD